MSAAQSLRKESKNMTVLVLGGAGYIGSHTVKALCDEGTDVVVVDNLVTGYEKAVDKRARFYKGDISDKEFLNNMFSREKIDAVIHFAAFSLVGESVTNPLKYYKITFAERKCFSRVWWKTALI